jgi:hypothetical protein
LALALESYRLLQAPECILETRVAKWRITHNDKGLAARPPSYWPSPVVSRRNGFKTAGRAREWHLA